MVLQFGKQVAKIEKEKLDEEVSKLSREVWELMEQGGETEERLKAKKVERKPLVLVVDKKKRLGKGVVTHFH